MRGSSLELTVGERVSFYRRRRGMTQVALAGLIGRSESWVEKIESGRAPLDRVSVIRDLARALDIRLHDLLPDDIAPMDVQHGRSVPALRELVLSYRAVNPRFAAIDDVVKPVDLAELARLVDDIWTAYQDSRFGYAIMRLNYALPVAYVVARQSATRVDGNRALALLYQVAASVLVKLGDLDLARLCADRGDIAAQVADDLVTQLSLQRSIAHTLLSNGQFAEAVSVIREGIVTAPDPRDARELSVLGTLMLVGATASSRAGERSEASAFLRHADLLAGRLGKDRNEVWTCFGPTNVAIHRVTVAAELGDHKLAIDVGAPLDTTALPRERQIRHQLELARAHARLGERAEALSALLTAEMRGPEQVRRHFLTHELVHGWMRMPKTTPELELVALARRLGHAH